MVIPMLMGAIGESGAEVIADRVLVLETEKGSRTFTDVAERPVLSLLRGFSAPVRLEFERPDADLLLLARHDRDPFNRWEALQTYATRLLKRSVAKIRAGKPALTDAALARAMGEIVRDGLTDPAFAELMLTLPGESDIAREIGTDVDPEAIAQAVDALADHIGRACLADAQAIYNQLAEPRPFSADARSAGERALKSATLALIARGDRDAGALLALDQYRSAATMTDRMSALRVLNRLGGPEREEAFTAFEAAYGTDALILDNWFTLNALVRSDDALARVRELTGHAAFSITNPNRVRALVGAFANANPRQFHRADGEGYRFVSEFIRDLDSKNPQVAARLATAFRTFATLEPGRRALARQALEMIQGQPTLSRDLKDIVDRALT
jgi:aminopeptidase N